jgi:hypothetical protein
MTIKDIEATILTGIKEDLENGLLENDVADKWCSRNTYYRWKREILRVNDKGEVVDESGKVLTKNEKGEWVGEPVFEFANEITKAIVTYKHKIIAAVTLNSIKSGRVGLEVLRRRFPKDWNVPLKTDLTSKGKFIGNVVVLPNNGRDTESK